MRGLILLFLVAFTLKAVASSATDTLSHFPADELVFHSPFEKSAFACMTEGSSCDYMKIALATDRSVSDQNYRKYRRNFYTFLDRIREDRRFQRRPDRQIRFIFSAIHDEYFRLYRDNPLFSSIFTTGEYNCVTASVLYALAFEYYNIPYDIILLTDHVYLLAYPQQQSIVVETTNPLRGAIMTYDQRDKAKAVQTLIDMKLVTREDVNQKGIDRIFSEVYLAEDTPTLKELMGTLYFNKASLRSELMLYTDAYEYFKKASFFYPNRMTTGLLILNASMILARADYQDPYSYRILADMEKFIRFGIPTDAITSQGIAFMNNALNAGNESMMDSIYTWLNATISIDTIRREIKYAYHFNKSLKLISDFRVDEALDLLETAYGIKPGDHNLNMVFMETLARKLGSQRDPQVNYEYISSMAKRTPELTQNKRFQMLYQGAILSLINHYFVQNNFEKAENYRSAFESQFSPEEVESPEIVRYLEEVYSRASLHYFRVNRIPRARAVLVSGLEYAPSSMELRSKLYALH